MKTFYQKFSATMFLIGLLVFLCGVTACCPEGEVMYQGECKDEYEVCLLVNCEAELVACVVNSSCASLLDCMTNCSTDTCMDTCVDEYPDGVEDLSDVFTCEDNQCSDECY